MVGCAVAFTLGVWLEKQVGITAGWLFLLAFLALSTFGFASITNKGKKEFMAGILLMCWLIAGMLRMEMLEQQLSGSIVHYAGQTVLLYGKISEPPVTVPDASGEWKVRYVVDLQQIRAGDGKKVQNVSGGVLISMRQGQPQVNEREGDRISFLGTVGLFHAYRNPGQMDWINGLAIRGIDARVNVQPGTIAVQQRAGKNSLLSQLKRWRNEVYAAMLAAMPDRDAALITGMLFGGYTGIDSQMVQDFSLTGIVHILSVSGAHLALVAAAVFWMIRRLGVPELWGAVIAASVMGSYGFLCGFSAPVARSVLMGLIAMVAIGFDRLSSSTHALAAAVVGMLAWEPRNLFDISFQLSVGCTAGLLYIYPPIAGWLEGVVKPWIGRGIAVTMATQLAVLPFLAWYFGQVSVISLVANLGVVPLLEGVIVLGLGGALFEGGFPAITHVLFVLLSLVASLAVEINHFLAQLPVAAVNVPAMSLTGSCVYYFFLLWIVGLGPARFVTLPQVLARWPLCAAFFSVTLIFLSIVSWLRPAPLAVHFIDVGQGDATLLITPHGQSVLVDTGGNLDLQNTFDVGERVVVPYLKHYGVKTVDWLILTHAHQDHAGGAAAVAKLMGVRQAVVRKDDQELAPALLRLRQVLPDKKIKDPEHMDEIKIDGVRLQLFKGGERRPETVKPTKAGSEENERSIAIRVEYGRHSFLLTGDLEGESENRIVENGIPATTVLKVGHHGARRSSQTEFLTRVTPKYALISVGADNRFGHPAPETVMRLLAWPVQIFRTDRDGAVVFYSDGESLTVEKTVR